MWISCNYFRRKIFTMAIYDCRFHSQRLQTRRVINFSASMARWACHWAPYVAQFCSVRLTACPQEEGGKAAVERLQVWEQRESAKDPMIKQMVDAQIDETEVVILQSACGRSRKQSSMPTDRSQFFAERFCAALHHCIHTHLQGFCILRSRIR